MARLTNAEAMRLAIDEGKKGAGFVSPNPLVGCVILDRVGELVAVGHHARVGENHAETNALARIADPAKLQGAHVFVTLEPCAHVGRTPACAKILASLPIASVTYGVHDPNPLVSGQGAAILREAGKQVQMDSCGLERELNELCEIFLLNMRESRPFVAVKVASSLDGQIALKSGESQWITGEESRAYVQYLRGCYDAVLTGLGTFLRDDPRLNSRDQRFAGKPSRAILLDPEGKSFAKLKSSQLFSVRAPEDLIVVTAPLGHKPPVGRHIEIADADGSFDLFSLMPALQAEGLHSIFVEAGPYTASQFIRSKMTDRLYLFLAPKLLGDGLSWTSGFSLGTLSHAVEIEDARTQSFGPDLMITGRPRTRFS